MSGSVRSAGQRCELYGTDNVNEPLCILLRKRFCDLFLAKKWRFGYEYKKIGSCCCAKSFDGY